MSSDFLNVNSISIMNLLISNQKLLLDILKELEKIEKNTKKKDEKPPKGKK